jgi:integrase
MPSPLLDLRSLFTSWQIILRSEGKSKETLRAYRISVELFLEYSQELTRDAVVSWLAEMDAEPATARLRLASVKQFAKWLGAEEGLAEADAIRLITPPKLDQKAVDSCSYAEVAALIKACSGSDWRAKRDKAMLTLLAETGLRRNELLALDADDVDLISCVATVRKGKGNKGRRVKFSPAAAAAIDRYRRAAGVTDGPLWLGVTGRLSATGMRHSLGQRAEQAGVKGFHVHRLRHTMAVTWLARGGTESGLMAQGGWSDRTMIDRYVGSAREQLAAEEFDRLGMGLSG